MKTKNHDLRPRVITLATGKGGAGKSTLARALGIYWTKQGDNIAILDADPQASIANLHNPTGVLKNLTVYQETDEDKIAPTVEALKTKHQHIIIDTAGFKNRTTIMACLAADLVLIPLKPAAEDVREAIAMYELIKELNATPERKAHPIQIALVLTMVTKGTVIARQISKELRQAGYPLCETNIHQRVSFPEFSMTGSAPSILGLHNPAAREINKLAREIEQIGEEAHVKAA